MPRAKRASAPDPLPNAFIGRAEAPAEKDLAAGLGPAKVLWDQLLSGLAQEHKLVVREWNSYSPKAGWSLRLKLGKRNILYLSPCRGSFRAAFALSDRAVEAARNSGLPPGVIRNIEESKRYAEGTAVCIDVGGPEDLTIISRLTKVKLEN